MGRFFCPLILGLSQIKLASYISIPNASVPLNTTEARSGKGTLVLCRMRMSNERTNEREEAMGSQIPAAHGISSS